MRQRCGTRLPGSRALQTGVPMWHCLGEAQRPQHTSRAELARLAVHGRPAAGGGKQPHLGRREGYHGKNKTEHVAYWSAPSLPYDCTNCSSCVSERGAASPYCDGFVLIQVLYLLLSLHFILDGMYGFVQEAALQCCSAFSSSLLCQAQYSVVSFISMEKSRANPNLSSRPLS